MDVAEIMRRDVKKIDSRKSLFDCIKKMTADSVNSLIVVKDSKPEGIITSGDIIRFLAKGGSLNAEISKAMTKNLITATSKTSLEEAAEIMVSKKVKKLPIMEKGEIIGIVSATDLISYEEKLIQTLSLLFLHPKAPGFAA